MKKPWSISTTVRNPERIREFLRVLKKLEGKVWNRENQKKFQVFLIQARAYGYGSQQFYNSLPKEDRDLIESEVEISFEKAEQILDSKNYVGGGDMRGRQSFNPLEKMGLVFLDEKNKIGISAVGEYLLKENSDLGDVFFKSFLKWQLPNMNSDDFKSEEGFNVNPFIATLHLINNVNLEWKHLGKNPVGLSKKEFSLFVPTLIDYRDIEEISKRIINLRLESEKSRDKKNFFKGFAEKYIRKFLNTQDSNLIASTLKNIFKDYSDNIIRYFRLTRYISLRGNGYYIDLEPRRLVEIKLLIDNFSGKSIEFKSRTDYIKYLSEINQPKLPWDNEDELKRIVTEITNEIRSLKARTMKFLFKEKDYHYMNSSQLKEYIRFLRIKRRELQEEIEHTESQDIEKIKLYISVIKKDIYSMENRPLMLEKYITLSLNALNDALRIKPNYPVGDDNEPINTAPGSCADIECFYDTYNAICEATLLRDRTQWYNEGQPVMRHLKEFSDKNKGKKVYCLFIAPELHIDTIETFWFSINHGYRGEKQKIIPLSFNNFLKILDILIIIKEKNKMLKHESLSLLYNSILKIDKIKDSDEWMDSIPKKIEEWKKEILV
jgi:hypothetical protein